MKGVDHLQDRPRDRPRLGIMLRILSGVFMAGMFVCVKAVSDDIPLGEIVFFRAFFAVIPLLAFLWLRGEFPSGLATKRPGAHLLRSAFGALALFASFAAVARLNIAEALLISQLSPVLMAIGAVILLSERLTVWRLWGVLLGFAGVIIMLWPELQSTTEVNSTRVLGMVIGIIAAALSALSLIMVRTLNRTESPGAIALYFVIASMAGALLTIPLGWVLPSSTALLFLIASGLFGGFGHIAMTLSFRYAEASRLAPFEYIAFLWPLLADLFIFGFPLSTTFALAVVLIFLGAGVASFDKSTKDRS